MADRDYTIIAPDGRELTIVGPDNATPQQLRAAAESAFAKMPKKAPPPAQAPAPKAAPSMFSDPSEQYTTEATQAQALGALGALRGIGDVGNTILNAGVGALKRLPRNPVSDAVSAWNDERQAGLKSFDEGMKADPTSDAVYGTTRVVGNIAATAPVGGVLAQGAKAVGAGAPVVNALASSGMTTGRNAVGALNVLKDVGLRSAAGATTGFASAGLVDPEQAKTGALVGGALPIATKTAGLAGNAIGGLARKALPQASPEVAALADRAKALGIDLPADRLVDSRPLNALASSLNYVPLSGRAAVEDKMMGQFNRAVSKTIGQNSENMAQALRTAAKDLGSKFDDVLTKNTVKVDQQFVTELAEAANKATRELGSDGASIIGKQVDDIIAKAGSGEIDGQAAYNIKKTLDRIGNRTTPEAYYARDLKKALMGALNRSLGPEEAAAFSRVRQQYGNMLDLEGLVPNGAEGGLSVGKLANMKSIGNPELQELADIAGQFLKSRESPHGAAQRLVLGGLGATAAGMGAAPYVAATVGVGRAANKALASPRVSNMVLGRANAPLNLLAEPELQLGYQTAPVFIATNPGR